MEKGLAANKERSRGSEMEKKRRRERNSRGWERNGTKVRGTREKEAKGDRRRR